MQAMRVRCGSTTLVRNINSIVPNKAEEGREPEVWIVKDQGNSQGEKARDIHNQLHIFLEVYKA